MRGRAAQSRRAGRRARELDPGYWFGGPEVFLGVYYAARPKIFGGDLKKSKEHFDAAGRPDFLLNRVLNAQYYAVAAQDKELFKSELNAVLDAPEALPEQALANGVAKKKAKRLWRRSMNYSKTAAALGLARF